MALSTTLLEPVSYNDIDQKYINDTRESIINGDIEMEKKLNIEKDDNLQKE